MEEKKGGADRGSGRRQHPGRGNKGRYCGLPWHPPLRTEQLSIVKEDKLPNWQPELDDD
jgi:hypothetical protein